MSQFSSPRGTRDILPAQQTLWNHVKTTCQQVAQQFSYGEITVPTFEETGLFQRSLGEGTDIIDKELFLVHGRLGEDEQYALRPEGTAGIVRAFIQNGLRPYPQPVRLATTLSVFRYERPQKGRYREHYQFDIEQFGDKSPYADGWIILTQWTILQRLGLDDAVLSLNSLGTSAERAQYQQQLVAYFTPFAAQLSPDSQRRLVTNPLRILDSKDALDQPFLGKAPSLAKCLGSESSQHFALLQNLLKEWEIPYTLDPHLVRGLDYYSQTCFEWSIPQPTGRPLALGGGGRYDTLVTLLGGPDTGAVGAGLGLDRVVDLLIERGWQPSHSTKRLALIDAGAGSLATAALLPALIKHGLNLSGDLSRESVASQLKLASKDGSTHALLVMPTGMELKELMSGEQQPIHLEELPGALA